MKKITLIIGLIWTLSFVGYGQTIGGVNVPDVHSDVIPDTEAIIDIKEVPEYEELEVHLPMSEDFSEFVTSYRRIYFIHGLGGDASAWTRVADACWNPYLNIPNFPTRTCEVSRVEYTSSTMGSLATAAYDVSSQVRSKAFEDMQLYRMDPKRAFIVAHSQGGLVGRSMIHNDLTARNLPFFGKGYGGFVSVASPLGGAEILNNRDLIIELAEESCNALTAGPLEQNALIHTFITLFAQEIVNDACEVVANQVLPLFFNDYFNPITEDYKVAASWLDYLDADCNLESYRAMPKVAFYAVEPHDLIFWRTANWLINNPNDEAAFQANADFTFFDNQVLPMYLEYATNFTYHLGMISHYRTLLASIGWMLIPALPIIIYISHHQYKAGAWGMGCFWFQNVNLKWEVITGGLSFRESGTPFYYCSGCDSGIPIITEDYNFCQNNGCDNIQRRVATMYTPVIKANDGIVTAESAIDLPYSTHAPVRLYPNEGRTHGDKVGSSHMQVRNDEGLRNGLYRLLEGEFGMYFKTRAL